jgi:hypothetical protein
MRKDVPKYDLSAEVFAWISHHAALFYIDKLSTFFVRLIGFGCCFALGWVLSIIGTLILFGGTSAANIRLFIVFYIFGNVICKLFSYPMLPVFHG